MLSFSLLFTPFPFRLFLLCAVDHAQEAVPADGDDVDEEDAVVQGHELEVDELDEGPEHVVGLQGGPVALLELLLRASALHDGHAAQEEADEGRREQELVAGHARRDGGVGAAAHHDVALQEAEPGRGGGAEDGFKGVSVSKHGTWLRVIVRW